MRGTEDEVLELRSALAKAEEALADLEASHDTVARQRDEAQAERDAALRNLADAQKDNAANAEEAESLRLDNAALVGEATNAAAELRHAYGHVALGQHINPDLVARAIRILETALSQPHPGTALLEELARLRECARLAGEHAATCATSRLAEADRHREELAAARHADDNTRAFTEAFCATVEEAEKRASAPKGGQSVPDHGDFSHVPPSTRGQLRWWARCGRAALKGERSALLVRARNEGLERAAKLVRRWQHHSLAKEIRALKEPEE